MPHLSVCLLCSFCVTLDGQPVTRFHSDKARALLAYLAVENERPHRREMLAGLLWPDRPERNARQNLSQALYNLREILDERGSAVPLLHANYQTLHLPPNENIHVDVLALLRLLEQCTKAVRLHGPCRHEDCYLHQAADLYQADLLPGFSLRDSPLFEEWLLIQRERLHRLALEMLQSLVDCCERRGDLERSTQYAWRWVELEPWHEEAHRALMRLLALGGERTSALAQYDACTRILRTELDVMPDAETTRLYEAIREGQFPQCLSNSPHAQPATPGLTSTSLVGERRLATGLMAEVSGSAAILDNLGADKWAETMADVHHILESEIERFGGQVDRRHEEGLTALFGVPVTHEDDPERAVLAALSIQDALRARPELRLRVGVDMGEVFVTSARGERQVVGRALTLTRRAGIAAEPGTVLVGENAYRLVRRLFEWAPQGALDARGMFRPLVHRALADKGRGIKGLSSPLVGRDDEFQALHEAVVRLCAGDGGIVTLVGEAGIGKSRLVAEVRQLVVSTLAAISDGQPPSGVQWIEGRCLSYGGSIAYLLWQDLLRDVLNVTPDTPPLAVRDALRDWVRALCPDDLDAIYPYLGRMLSLPLEEEAAACLRGLDARGLKVLTFRAVETLVERAAGQQSLVVACEDLHWADPTSLELLEQLLPLTDRVPLLFVCIFRPRMGHGCWQIRETVTRDYRHRHSDLWLKALSPAESEMLVGNLLRIEDLPRALRDPVLEHGEGNPFYVEEIIRSLINSGVIVHCEVGGRWQTAKDVTGIAIPDTLHGMLMARIDRLSIGAKRVLQLASVIGRIFSYRLLAAIAEKSGLDDHLVTLQRAQMIRERARMPEEAYIFEHQLTLDAAYGSLLKRVRRVLHQRVAEELERLFPARIAEQPGLLAHHWERAGDVEKAVEYLRRAGEQAAAQYANAEAVEYLSRALDLVPESSLADRYALLLARERVYEWKGDREPQGRDLATLGGWAEALGDKTKQAEVAVRLAHYNTRMGEYEQAISAARTAVRLAQDVQDAGREAMAYREWGRALFYPGRNQAARPHLERALALARDAGLRQVEAEILHTLGAVFSYLDNVERMVVCWEQELRICREIGDRRREGEALRDVGVGLAERGNWTEGEEYLQQSLRICRETGNRRDEAWALFFLGVISYFQGHYARARNYLEQGLPICREVGDRVGESRTLRILGFVHTALGDYATARGYYLEQGISHVERGLLFLLQGDYASARILYEELLDYCRERGLRRGEAYASLHMGLLSHHLGDDRAAREYSQQALPVMQNLDLCTIVVSKFVFTVLGHALAGLGHPEEAADAYRQALVMRRERGQHHLAVEPLAGLARVSLAQGALAEALAHVKEILNYLDDHPALHGTIEPLRIYLTCYRVLLANGDPHAGEILDAAYRLLQERASKIEDADLRRSYLENLPAHREIVATWVETSHL